MTSLGQLVNRSGANVEISAVEVEKIRVLPSGLLRAGDAAKFLGLSKRTLSNWRCLGLGPAAVKRGGRVYYPLTHLQEWLETGKTNQPRGPTHGHVQQV